MLKHQIYWGNGGWWGRVDGHGPPLGNWRMDRGPYPLRWMALLSFPIRRWFK